MQISAILLLLTLTVICSQADQVKGELDIILPNKYQWLYVQLSTLTDGGEKAELTEQQWAELQATMHVKHYKRLLQLLGLLTDEFDGSKKSKTDLSQLDDNSGDGASGDISGDGSGDGSPSGDDETFSGEGSGKSAGDDGFSGEEPQDDSSSGMFSGDNSGSGDDETFSGSGAVEEDKLSSDSGSRSNCQEHAADAVAGRKPSKDKHADRNSKKNKNLKVELVEKNGEPIIIKERLMASWVIPVLVAVCILLMVAGLVWHKNFRQQRKFSYLKFQDDGELSIEGGKAPLA